jgi:cysteine desulfurase
MWVNNETGVMQPVAEVARRASSRGIAVHSDAVQAVGKVPVRFGDTGLACLSVTGHKIYGPKSTGVLLVRQDTEVFARLHGGGQERGLRPGTPDVAGAVGLAEAISLAVAEQPALAQRYSDLRARMETRLLEGVPGLRIHGGAAERSPHVLNVGVPEVDAQMLTVSLDLEGLAVSGGSACASGSASVSHVISAMYGDDALPAAVRYSFGRATTSEDVDRAVDITLRVIGRLRPAGAPA